MKAETVLIHRPDRQPRLQRAGFALMTIMAWTLWMSLWLPVLTLFAWLLGLGDAYRQFDTRDPLRGAGDLSIVLLLAGACALMFTGWSLYNRVRFSKNRRRRGDTSLDVAHVAEAIGASVRTAESMRANRRSVVYVSGAGRLYVRAT